MSAHQPQRLIGLAALLLAACVRPAPPLTTPLPAVDTQPVASVTLAAATLAANPTAAVTLVPAVAPPAPDTPPPEPTPAATTGPVNYTIQEGDTLWALAERFGLPAELLAAANPELNPDLLFPGAVLLIPDPSQPLLGVTIEPGALDAQVLPDATGLRVRAEPNTQAIVLAHLAAFTPLEVTGRTADATWLQIITPLGQTEGWVSAEFVEVFVVLDELPVIAPGPVATLAVGVLGTAAPLAATTPVPPGDYHYYSGITGRAREIFLYGQALGNRRDVFSKVGDSITVSSVFLSPLGLARYNLGAYTELQPVIDYYVRAEARAGANSFANPSLSAKVGWRARAVLSPASADPAVCQPDESALACEYRLVRPAVALIMLGTNDVPFTPVDEYEADMRRVIELTLERGIIPVISTIPPLFRTGLEGRVELLNGVLVKLSGEYQVPLWDYWAALQALPNTGMAGDGVHPTWAPTGHSADFTPEFLQYGMTVRNLTGLYVLDALWKEMIGN